MRYLRLAWRIVSGFGVALIIAAMAWYLWLQDDYFKAYDEFTA